MRKIMFLLITVSFLASMSTVSMAQAYNWDAISLATEDYEFSIWLGGSNQPNPEQLAVIISDESGEITAIDVGDSHLLSEPRILYGNGIWLAETKVRAKSIFKVRVDIMPQRSGSIRILIKNGSWSFPTIMVVPRPNIHLAPPNYFSRIELLYFNGEKLTDKEAGEIIDLYKLPINLTIQSRGKKLATTWGNLKK